MIRVLISAPSMDVARNVSGVSSVVMQITHVLSGSVEFIHLEIGSEQAGRHFVRLCGSVLKTTRSLFTVLTSRFDVLHSNTAMNPKSIIRDLAIVVAARLRGKAVLLHVHGGIYVHERPPRFIHLAMLSLCHLSNCIVVLSRTELSYFMRSYPETTAKIEFIYNGIELLQKEHEIKRKAFPSDRLRIAFIGRLAPEKGLPTLISACYTLNDADGFDIQFFGVGELLPDLLVLAGQKAFLSYRGIFHPSESCTILKDFDALVLPSVRGEGMPMAVIEAMSVGVVPICTPISSIPEIVTDGETGLLIEIGSANAIVDAFFRLKSDAEARRRIGCAASKFAKANFDAHQNFNKLNSVYQKICRRSRF